MTSPYDQNLAFLDALLEDPANRRPRFGSTCETRTERSTLGCVVTSVEEIFADADDRPAKERRAAPDPGLAKDFHFTPAFWLGVFFGLTLAGRQPYQPTTRSAKLSKCAHIAVEYSEAAPIPPIDHDKAKTRLAPWIRPICKEFR